MGVQRWKFLTLADDNGDLVTYADHVAAVEQARADEREACIAAVKALRDTDDQCTLIERERIRTGVTGIPMADERYVPVTPRWVVSRVLAVIDGEASA